MSDNEKKDELNPEDFGLEEYRPEPMLMAAEMQEQLDGSEPPPSFGTGFFTAYKGEKNSKFYKAYALGSMKGNWDVMLMSTIIYVILVVGLNAIYLIFFSGELPGTLKANSVTSISVSILINIALFVLLWGYIMMFLGVVRRESPQLSAIFDGFNRFVKVTGVMLLLYIVTFLGLILFLVPGVMIFLRYCMSVYLIKDRPELSIIGALKESACLMMNYKMKFFKLQLSFIGWFFLGIATCGIAYFYVLPYYYTTCASFYEDLRNNYKNDVT